MCYFLIADELQLFLDVCEWVIIVPAPLLVEEPEFGQIGQGNYMLAPISGHDIITDAAIHFSGNSSVDDALQAHRPQYFR